MESHNTVAKEMRAKHLCEEGKGRELAWSCIVSAPQGSSRLQPEERPSQQSRVYSAGLCPSGSPVRRGVLGLGELGAGPWDGLC